MVDCWELEDSSGRWELEDGSGCWLLELQPTAGGVQIVGQHATQLIGPRAARLDPVEFTFQLKACTITLTKLRVCVKSTLITESLSHLKLKALLIVESQSSSKLKAAILVRIIESTVKIQSNILTKISHTFMVGSKTRTENLKKALLKKLREMMEDDDN